MPSTCKTEIPRVASPWVTFGSDAFLTILIFKWFEDTQVKPPERKAELGQTQCALALISNCAVFFNLL